MQTTGKFQKTQYGPRTDGHSEWRPLLFSFEKNKQKTAHDPYLEQLYNSNREKYGLRIMPKPIELHTTQFATFPIYPKVDFPVIFYILEILGRPEFNWLWNYTVVRGKDRGLFSVCFFE